MNLRAYRSLTIASLRMYVRNPVAASAVFLGLLLFIFALKFLGDGTPHVKVLVVDRASSAISARLVAAVESMPAFEVVRGDSAALAERVEDGSTDLGLELRSAAGDRLEAVVSYKESPGAATGVALLRGVVGDWNLAALGGTPPVTLRPAPIAGRSLGAIDQMLPGLLAFNIVQSSLLFAAGLFASYRSTGVLRRIQATGVDASTFVLAIATGTFVVSFAQTIGLVIAARVLYTMQLDLLPLVTITALGIVVFLAMGFAISGFVRDAQRAPSIAATVAMPMIFVGLFPPSALPAAVAPVMGVLPISLITTAMRQLADNPGVSLLPQILGLAAWAVISLLAAGRAFRWD